MNKKRKQRQKLILLQQPDKQEQEQEQQKQFEIIILKPVCIKKHRVKGSIHSIKHNIWYNRARRRYNKASYFSERA